ncbi:MAG: DUF4342 domain-containing protein [Rhodoglobus sp.]
MTEKNANSEEFKVSAENLVGKVREIIEDGNVKRVIIKNDQGHTLLEIPLNAGLAVAGLLVFLTPVLAAVAAVAAVVTQVTIVVEKQDPAESEDSVE